MKTKTEGVKKLTAVHKPVLVDEVLKNLNIKDNSLYMDCTLGEGGHSKAILDYNSSVRVVGLEQDRDIEAVAKARLAEYDGRFESVSANFLHLKSIAARYGIKEVSGILMDLGISMYHYMNSGKGFSFSKDESLDMRLSNEFDTDAAEIVNHYSESRLVEIFKNYSEEKFARRIAGSIVRARKEQGIHSTKELSQIVASAIPRKFWPPNTHPATRTFQAIRIEVNKELEVLESALPQAVSLLKPGGRLCVITFHSIEDRIVKDYFKTEVPQCICPPQLPMCTCGRPGKVKIITKKPVTADESEIKRNPSSRSAKLRVVERLK